ncbi:hypothetical protein [Faecalispora jeddahensis]|uniref:hypothetical protein n=1 Tax=Faecalispora jeddahensis TaxID=1414721 RepID=UPI0005A75C71|nr:hypothetical protein [Faecalispora jeddahensis]
MKYKVIMQNVGRNKLCSEKTFEDEPAYLDLYGMVRGALLSSEIDFDTKDSQYPIHGTVVVGGWRAVGYFTVEQIETEEK